MVALLVTAIVFVIAAAIFAQAIHNVVQSGYGRRRLTAVNAAEAGLNWYASQLGGKSLSLLGGTSGGAGWTVSCGAGTDISNVCWYRYAATNAAAKVASVPEAATFEIRVLYSSASPCPASGCGLANIPLGSVLTLQSSTTTPFPDVAYAVVRSTGTVGTVQRTLESYVRLRAIRNNIRGGLSAVALCLGSGATVLVQGDLAVSNQGDASRPSAFTDAQNGCPETDLLIRSGRSLKLSAVGTSAGSLFIGGGGLDVSTNGTLWTDGDVQAEGAITLGNGSGGASCPGNEPRQCVTGDALGTSVSRGSNAWIGGDAIACDPACPPDIVFPDYTWNPSDWTAPWSVVELSSNAQILQKIDAATSDTVFHITSTTSSSCDVDFDRGNNGNSDITLGANVAVISSCRFAFSQSSAAIYDTSSGHALLLISVSPASGGCGAASNSPYGPHDVEVAQNTTIQVGLFIYTPCIMWIANNQNPSQGAGITGQFAARYIMIKNTANLVENPLGNYLTSLPGQISGFYQDIKFVREIPTSAALCTEGGSAPCGP